MYFNNNKKKVFNDQTLNAVTMAIGFIFVALNNHIADGGLWQTYRISLIISTAVHVSITH